MVNEEAQAVCVSRRLAICVVFYDNYKYGRKALCLEQLVRLSKLWPLLATAVDGRYLSSRE